MSVVLLLALLFACGPSEPPQPPPELLEPPTPPPNAAPLVAVGDVHADRATIATRTSGYSRAWVTLDTTEGAQTWRSEDAEVLPSRDFTAHFTVRDLPPQTELLYTVHASTTAAPDPGQPVFSGRFTTAPTAETPAAVTLAVIGDLGGQQWCRPVDGGYAILGSVLRAAPDLLIANGDMIYADGDCPSEAPDGAAQVAGDFPSVSDPMVDWSDGRRVREILHSHWRYNRQDEHHQALLAAAPLVAQWDDHEVVNDMGAPWERWLTGDPERPGYPTLVEAGREAFFAWNPIERHPEDPTRIYRSLRWGQHVELFVVDARSYRSPNGLPDGSEKTLLGEAQLAWLIAAVSASDATWKILSVDVPMSVPTGSKAWRAGRDGWASGVGDPSTPEGEEDISATTGYERELKALLSALDARDLGGLVFVTTDVHFAQTIRYNTDFDGDGDRLELHELVTGPLRAWMGEPPPLDPSFKPENLYAEGLGSFYSVLRISEDGRTLTATVHGADGEVREGSELVLTR